MSTPAAASHPDAPVPGASNRFSPAVMMDVELAQPLPPVSYDGTHRRAGGLGRLHGEPVGSCVIRREALARTGGFDVAMGAGTPARASEDTLALTLVLLAGYRIAYEPAALVRHDHYAEMDGLIRQLRGYGVGIGAYYTALLRHRCTRRARAPLVASRRRQQPQ